MDANLLRELDEAGWGKNADGTIPDDYCPPSLGCCEPTLEELIEACVKLSAKKDDGSGDFHLEHSDDVWQASTCWRSRPDGNDWIKGDNPTETVARLWLALCKEITDA